MYIYNLKNMKKVNIKIIVFFIGALISLTSIAQAQDFKSKFSVVNRLIQQAEVANSVALNEEEGVGIAWINDEEFTYGEIEFEAKGSDEFQGSFLGIAFQGLNDSTYQAIYFRPFNFLVSDQARKSHAVQYMSLPHYDWPVLREQFPNKYESAIVADVDPNNWFHVRLSVKKELIEVFVNRRKEPIMQIIPIGNTKGNKIGYWVGNGSGGQWRNLKLVKD